jgi:hypothetical protein
MIPLDLIRHSSREKRYDCEYDPAREPCNIQPDPIRASTYMPDPCPNYQTGLGTHPFPRLAKPPRFYYLLSVFPFPHAPFLALQSGSLFGRRRTSELDCHSFLPFATMGVLQDVSVHLDPLAQRFFQLGIASQVGVVVASVVFLSVFLNVAQQIFFKNPNEPPVVFHWFPWIGSTVTYGINPPVWLKENRAKVRISHNHNHWPVQTARLTNVFPTVWRRLYFHPARQEDDGHGWTPGQRLHSQRKAQGRLGGGDLHTPYHACIRQGCRIRLSQLEAHGAEEGWFST